MLCRSLSITQDNSAKPRSTCGSSFSCPPHWLRPLPFRTVPSGCRPNIRFSVTVNYPALIFCSFYVFYATLRFFPSRDFKVLVADCFRCQAACTGFPGGSDGKESTCRCRRGGFDPWVRKIPGGGNSHLVQCLHGESNGCRSLVGCSPWGHRESDTA